MPKYRVVSPHFTLGDVGDVVELDDVPGLNVRALVKARALLPVVAVKKSAAKKKSTATDEGAD